MEPVPADEFVVEVEAGTILTAAPNREVIPKNLGTGTSQRCMTDQPELYNELQPIRPCSNITIHNPNGRESLRIPSTYFATLDPWIEVAGSLKDMLTFREMASDALWINFTDQLIDPDCPLLLLYAIPVWSFSQLTSLPEVFRKNCERPTLPLLFNDLKYQQQQIQQNGPTE